jgi:hypothetical protein
MLHRPTPVNSPMYKLGVKDALDIVEDVLGDCTIGTAEAEKVHAVYRRIKQEIA